MNTYQRISWVAITIVCMVILVSTTIYRQSTMAATPRDVALPTAGIVAPPFRGQAIPWGISSGNLHRLPVSTQSGVKQLAVNDHHALAITANNTVVGWGINLNGELTIPRTLSNVVQVTTGITHSAALNATGNVTIWGHANVLKQGRSFSNIVQIASGDAHVVLLRNGGGIIVAGGTTAQRAVPSEFNCGGVVLCNAARAAVAVAAGSDSSVVLSANGDITQWGSARTVPTAAHTDMVQVFASGNTYAALNPNGTLIVWGAVDNLDISAVSGATRLDEGGAKYLVVPNMTGIIEVASAKWGIALVRRSGVALTIPYYTQQAPTLPDARIVTLGMHRNHSCGVALSYAAISLLPTATTSLQLDTLAVERFTQMGNVVAWGDDSDITTIPSNARDGTVIQIVAGRYHVVALRNDSVVVAWGDNMYGQSTIPTTLDDVRVADDPMRVVAVAAGGNHSVALRANGEVIVWGDNTFNQLQVPTGLKPIVQISAGARHTIALQNDGTLVGWGDNSAGQITVPKVAGVQKIASGYFHNLALLRNGEIFTWGSNSFGQLTLPPLSNVVDVAASNANSMFLHRDGRVTVLGLNSDDQRNVPNGIYQHVDAGFNHLLAIDATGQPVAWGLDTNNQTTIPPALTRALMLAGGSNFSVALVPNSAAFVAPTPQPTREQRNMRFTRVAAGSESALATVDGNVVVWGNDASNQLAMPALS
ncbi:MAG: RCC1 domain-containing protein, partial [Roseiflexaceae bacterium]